jgi:hypothetical protein
VIAMHVTDVADSAMAFKMASQRRRAGAAEAPARRAWENGLPAWVSGTDFKSGAALNLR